MNSQIHRNISVDEDWRDVANQWELREDTTYLNHGSFGPPPRPVRETRLNWIRQLDSQPMDFFVRQFEPALLHARARLAEFVGTNPANLIFVENATYAMNVVAASFDLKIGDQVLINNHEYGAVRRIWQRACHSAGAELVEVQLPFRFEFTEQIIDPIVKRLTNRTRLLIFSHITSPTAVIFPVIEICRLVRQRGVAVCIDGPHALAQVDLRIDEIGCDFYAASCHKWLSAPFGSGFLFVRPEHQPKIRPLLLSWGRLLPDLPTRWDEEFAWVGTRDPSPYLSVPAAIDFIANVGVAEFRQRCHYLVNYARHRLEELLSEKAIVPDDPQWYGSMTEVPLPDVDWSGLQSTLWNRFRIEVPIVHFSNRWFIRVSCHLYNSRQDIDHLIESMTELMAASKSLS